MNDVSVDELAAALESQHGGKAALAQSVPVREMHGADVAWEGVVHVFDLANSPSGADRAYAWSTLLDEKTGKRRFYAVLHAGPVKSPADAVRAAIVAEHRGKV